MADRKLSSSPVIIEAPFASESQWNEEKISSALVRLREMHSKLRHLRETVPRAAKPMIDLQNCLPKSLYFNFSQIATSSAKEIENFANLIQADTSQEVFNRAKESQAESPEGITWWKVTEHDDWLNVQQEKYPQDLTLPMKEDTIPNNYEVENVKNVLENFQKGKDYIELSFIDKKSWKIKIYLTAPASLHFEISIRYNVQEYAQLEVYCKGSSKMHSAISDVVSAMPTSDLEILLEMLASYRDIRSRPCLKCGRLLDPNALFPVVRRQEKTKTMGIESQLQWQALHRGCA